MVGPFIEMENIEWGGAGLGGYGIRNLVFGLPVRHLKRVVT